MIPSLLVALLAFRTASPSLSSPCVYWTGSVEDTAVALKSAAIATICVPPDRADAWRAAGFDAVAISDADLADREAVPEPGIASRVDLVSSTRSPWVDANGWRFVRKPGGRYVYDLPVRRGALAAAEALTFRADAVLKIDPADLQAVGDVLAFARGIPALDLRPVADIGVVDDGTPEVGEVMNLLGRRNLLYEPIAARSTHSHAVTVKLGTKKYPRKAADSPSEFALQVRHELTDDRRSLRVYGSEVVLARLTGDARRRRLQLVNYSGREIQGLRIRLRGAWRIDALRVAGKSDAAPQDVAVVEGATEFSIPEIGVYALVDLLKQ
jgi:alkylhydroperoxidase family enzyme